jgi:hypothetical protein
MAHGPHRRPALHRRHTVSMARGNKVPQGSFRDSVHPPRPLAGDVIGARRVAVDLLQGPSPSDPGGAIQRLVLTAVCLHVDSQHSDGANLGPVVAYLHRILTEAIVDPALVRSPMQFVRYAASELGAMTAEERTRIARQLIARIDPLAPTSGSPDASHKTI